MDALTALTYAFADGWVVTALSVANTAGAATKAAQAGKTHYIAGFSVIVDAAAQAASAVAIELKDGSTTIYADVLPASSAIGTKREVHFHTPIKITTGAAASINCGALGADSQSRLNLWGYTI